MQRVTEFWLNLPIRHKGLLVFLIPALCLLILLGTILSTQSEESNAQEWVRHSEQVRAGARRLLAAVVDAQSAVRGYDYTEDEAFLQNYHDDVEETLSALHSLQDLVADNPNQTRRFQRIDELARGRVAGMDDNLKVARGELAPEVKRAQVTRLLLEGRTQMGALRRELSVFDTEEERLLEERTSALAAQQQRSTVLLWVAALMGIAGGLLVLQLFTRGVTDRLAQLSGNADRVARGEPLQDDPAGRDEIGRLNAVFRGMVARVGEREERLRESRNALRETTAIQRAILDSANYMLISTGDGGLIQTFNPTAERLLGYSAEQMVGKQSPAVIHDPEEMKVRAAELSTELGMEIPATAEVFVAKARLGQPDEREWTYIRKDGSRFPVLLSVTALRSDDGEITGFLGVGADITERKQYEAALIEARQAAMDASSAKSEFLASMSHEIRTPMNAILGMADLLAETDLTPPQRRWVGVFRQAGSRLLQLINDILDLSRVEAGQIDLEYSEFGIRELVRETMDILQVRAVEKGLQLRSEIAPEVPARVMGDAFRVRQILMNLLGNALKFTEQGRVDLKVDRVLDSRVLVFTVSDTGPGIPEEKLRGIFEAFTQVDSSTTRKYGGTGLGLAISNRLAALMGGSIQVDSTPGRGSRFRFVAPFTVAQPSETDLAQRESALPSSTTGNGKRRRILLADDSPDNRLLIQAYLEKEPYDVETAENGEEAVKRYSEEPFDLVLMDVQMPKMDGLSATRAIREWETAREMIPCPILALTANALREDEERSRGSGCTEHLAKPIKRAVLLAALRRHLPEDGTHV